MVVSLPRRRCLWRKFLLVLWWLRWVHHGYLVLVLINADWLITSRLHSPRKPNLCIYLDYAHPIESTCAFISIGPPDIYLPFQSNPWFGGLFVRIDKFLVSSDIADRHAELVAAVSKKEVKQAFSTKTKEGTLESLTEKTATFHVLRLIHVCWTQGLTFHSFGLSSNRSSCVYKRALMNSLWVFNLECP